MDPSKISDVAAVLRPSHFYQEKHGLVYQVILDLDRAGDPVDFLTVTGALERSGKLASIGGTAYVMDLISAVPTAAHVDHYVSAVLKLASDRAAIRIASSVTQLAFKGKGEALQYLARQVEKEQNDYLGGGDGPVWLDDVTDKVVEDAVDLSERRARGEVVDLLTPWKELNDIIVSLLPGDYVVLTAPPSFGKSTVVHQIIDFAARSGHGSLFITTETTAASVSSRQLGKTVQMSPRLIRAGSMTKAGLERLVNEKEKAKIGPVLIDDTITSFDQVERCILQAKRGLEGKGFRLRLVVVDFLHQLTKAGHGDNKPEELGAISYGLRRLAGKYGITLIAVSEVNKASYATGGKPGSKDAGGSVKIHYSAGLGWVLDRDSNGFTVLTVDKNKDGPGGKFTLPGMTKNSPWFG
jgi:replicative DNA helicase